MITIQRFLYNDSYTMIHIQRFIYNGLYTTMLIQWSLYKGLCTMILIQRFLYNDSCTMIPIQWFSYNDSVYNDFLTFIQWFGHSVSEYPALLGTPKNRCILVSWIKIIATAVCRSNDFHHIQRFWALLAIVFPVGMT